MRLLLWGVLLSFSCVAYAEHGCQEGFVPVNQGNGQGQTCVADYNLPYWNNRDSGESTASGPQWETRWGAIAIDFREGKIGTASTMSSKRGAEKDALSDCRSNGGTACKLALSYHNQCGVMAWGESYATTESAETLEQASARAIRSCSAKSSDCQIYYSDCSLAERVR